MAQKTQNEAQKTQKMTQMHVVIVKLATDTTTTHFSPESRDRVTVRT